MTLTAIAAGQMLRTEDAADYLGLSPATLEKYRVTGGGPRYSKMGRAVRYPVAELDIWMASKFRASTSQQIAA